MKTLFFLYGTLKRGYHNHHLMDGQEYVGPVQTLPRYRLLDSGSYPCLVDDGAGVAVRGELWRVDEAALARLDRFEEVGHTFERRGVALEGVAEAVFAYFYRGDPSTYADCGEEWPAILGARPA